MLYGFKWIMIAGLTLGLLACAGDDKNTAKESARHLKTAQAYEKQGQFRAALLEARNVIQLKPDSAEGYAVLANIYNQIGAHRLTIKLLRDRESLSTGLDIYLAQAYLASKKYSSTVSLLEPLIETSLSESELLECYRLLGEAYLHLKETQKFERVVGLLGAESKGVQSSLFLQSEMDLSMESIDQAKNRLTELVTTYNNFDALTLLGDIALLNNELDSAESNYTKALGTLRNTDVLLANRSLILRRLIEVLVRSGRSGEAFAYQKLLSEGNPDSYAAQQKFSDAMQLYVDGDLQGASTLLKELREQFPQDKDSGTLLGLVAQKQGENELASQLFDEFVDTETVTPSVIQAAALAKLNNQKADEAVKMLKSAVDQQPNNAGILAAYGLALVELDIDSNEATMVLERSLALNPAQHRLRIALARSYMQKGKQEQALAQLKKAYTQETEDFLVQQAYFRTLGGLNKQDVLKQEVDAYRVANPDSAKGAFFSGWYEFGRKSYKSAIKEFTQAVKLNDDHINGLAYTGLAQSYEANDDLIKATDAWEDAIKSNPTSLGSYGQWLLTLKKRSLEKTAIERLDHFELEASIWQPKYIRAGIQFEFGDISAALATISEALDVGPEQPRVKSLAAEIYQQVAINYYKSGDVKGSKQALLKSVELMPGNISYVANLIKIELDAGDSQSAQKILNQYGGVGPELMARHYLQGKIYERSGDLPAALAAYKASWEVGPSDLTGDALFNISRSERKQSENVAFLDSWIAGIPSSSKPLMYKAMAMQASGDIMGAEALYLKALDIEPDLAAALNNLAWIYFNRDDDKAVSVAKRAYQLAPNSAPIMDTYGWILVSSGDLISGYPILLRASELAPNNNEISQHVDFAATQLKRQPKL